LREETGDRFGVGRLSCEGDSAGFFAQVLKLFDIARGQRQFDAESRETTGDGSADARPGADNQSGMIRENPSPFFPHQFR
jgi:hypothetical protein